MECSFLIQTILLCSFTHKNSVYVRVRAAVWLFLLVLRIKSEGSSRRLQYILIHYLIVLLNLS